MPERPEPSLTELERRVVQRLVEGLRGELGEELHAVWLYGSRARGEPPGAFSDVDLVVLTDRGRDDRTRVFALLWDAAEAEGAVPFAFSILVETPDWPARRRAIRDFFVAELDRDRVALA